MSGPSYPRPHAGAGVATIAPGAFSSDDFASTDFDVYRYSWIAPSLPVFDWWQTVQSQFANSDIITAIIRNFSDAIDPTSKFDQFFNLVWNVDTAQGWGLDVWGRIVGVNRALDVAAGEWFVFRNAAPDDTGFAETGNGAPFYSGQGLTSIYLLSDQAYRRLILAKAAFNLTSCAIPSINAILRSIFPGRGNCYVTEGAPADPVFGFAQAIDTEGFNVAPFGPSAPVDVMSISYVFEFALDPVDLAIVQQSGVLPRPAGVSSTVAYRT